MYSKGRSDSFLFWLGTAVAKVSEPTISSEQLESCPCPAAAVHLHMKPGKDWHCKLGCMLLTKSEVLGKNSLVYSR